MMALRRTNKELNDKLDNALDKIHDLESSNKELSSLQKSLDSARNHNVVLERQLFESQSLAISLEDQVKKLREEIFKEQQKQRRTEEENRALQQQIKSLNDDENDGADTMMKDDHGEDEDDMFGAVMNVSTLKQRLRDTKRQLKELQRQLQSTAASNSTMASSEGTGGADSIVNSAIVISLQQENETLKQVKKDREELVITLRKQLQDLTYERDTLRQQFEDKEHVSTNQSRDSQQRLHVLESTVKKLEERLKEREAQVTRLETDKNKLESYAKRSLTTFKEKFMTVLQTMREEKRELVQRIKAQAERMEKNQDSWRREERLLSAALFEVGVKIMDRSINAQLLSASSASQPNTVGSEHFLTAQREAVGRGLNTEHVVVSNMEVTNTGSGSPYIENNNNAARKLFSGFTSPQTK
jgi:peptidoglycan hydrolase-like protein with peptidoglycan-binding domain